MEVLGGLLGTFACIPDRQDKTRHDGDMLNYRKLAFANELQFEMGNCFLDRLAYNQAKGQIISEGFLVSSNSPKKQTNGFLFATMTNLFIRFLGRIQGHQKVLSKLSDL